MTLIQYVRLLMRSWLPIALATVILGTGVYLVSHSRDPIYTASSAEYFSLTVSNSPAELNQGSIYLQDQMSSYGQLATSPIVLNAVIDELGLDTNAKQLAKTITASTPRNTVVMQINVGNTDPARAAAIANAVSGQLTNAVDKVSPKLANGKSLVSVRTIQTALPPTIQSAPNTRRDTAFGLAIGLLLSCLVVIAIARLDSTVRTPGTLAEVTTRRLLGSVRNARNLAGRALVITADPQSRSAEDLRQVRASLEQVASGRPTFVAVITSSIRQEGRSTVAANLAAALAESGRRTVIVDADLRRPQIAQITATDPDIGLLNALADPRRVDDCVQTSGAAGLRVLAAGGVHDNPVELLSSPAMGSVISTLRQQYEFVIIDAPALLEAADAAAMHSQIDGVLILASARRVRREQLQDALRSADLAGLKTLGIVLNGVNARDLPSVEGGSGRRHGEQRGPTRALPAAAPALEDRPV